MKKIAFVPIDNRPVCFILPQQITACSDKFELFLPQRRLLGDLTTQSQSDKILDWLEQLDETDYLILSLDTIAYGGLIPSRRTDESTDEILKRLERLRQILMRKKSKVLAFSSIMRISDNNINEEEKTYWQEYGKKLFAYSFYTHKSEILNDNAARNQANFVSDTIPSSIIDDYLQTRERNFEINKIYLNWLESGIVDFLVYSKDDCAKYGFNVKEADTLKSLAAKRNLTVQVRTGADEIPLTLLSRVFADGKTIKIAPVFTQNEYKNKISKYEDISVEESVESQIMLAGARLSSKDDADLILLVNNFKNEQGELVMGIFEEGFKKSVNLPVRPYFIADVLNANGADNDFTDSFLNNQIDYECFFGYAGWNTTANTVGSAIAAAIAKFISGNNKSKAFKKLQMVRFLDDWAYQANVRQNLKLTGSIPPEDQTVKQEMKKYETKLNNILKTNYQNIGYRFPWNRFFELEIELK